MTELVEEVTRRLELDHQYIVTVPLDDEARINEIRAAGRKAAKILGWKVRTGVNDLGPKAVVWVAITESTPDEERRIRERSDLLMRDAFERGAFDFGGAE